MEFSCEIDLSSLDGDGSGPDASTNGSFPDEAIWTACTGISLLRAPASSHCPLAKAIAGLSNGTPDFLTSFSEMRNVGGRNAIAEPGVQTTGLLPRAGDYSTQTMNRLIGDSHSKIQTSSGNTPRPSNERLRRC